MKRNVRSILLALLLAALALAVSSCNLLGGDKYQFDDGEKDREVLSDLSEYILVRRDLSSDEEKEALVLLHTTLEKNLGAKLTVATDWLAEGETAPEKEILIGSTRRPESQKAVEGLGYNDYVIKMVGAKLVIAGGSGEATMKAVEYFIENYIDIYSASLSYPTGDGYKHAESFSISSITVSGTPLSEYMLYSDIEDFDFEKVQKALKDEIAGVNLEVEDEFNQYKKYIIFDNTELVASRYGTELDENGNLFVYGSYDTIDIAVEYFCDEYFAELRAEMGQNINIEQGHDRVRETGKTGSYTKESLLSMLKEVYEDKNSLIIGQNLGPTSMPVYALQRFYEGTGKYPAMLGIDLGFGGLHLTEITSAEWSRAICELTDFASKGGIISASALYENPTGNWVLGEGKYKGDFTAEDWKQLLTEESDLNTKFRRELSIYAAFIKALGDNKVPILFSPLGSANEAGYWFSASDEATAEQVKRLWIYIHDYYVSLGLDNIIWVYDPAMKSGEAETLPALCYYPGEAYVDLVGTSWLYNGENALDNGEASQKKLTETTSKIGAICKFGIDSRSDIFVTTKPEQEAIFNSLDLLDMLYDLRSKGYSFSYMLMSVNGDLYWLGRGAEFVEDEMILTLEDVAEMLK